MINVQHLSKSYGEQRVLDDVSFVIKKGSITGLIGHNGAGKTTLMRILCALGRPDSGSVHLGGVNLFEETARARALIGYVPQKTSLYPEMSGMENLRYFGAIAGLADDELEKSIISAAQATRLEEHLNKRVVHYSGGMQKRLNLAIGLLANPQILYLDEPTVGVDPETRDIILESLGWLVRTKETTILYSSHYFEEIERICHHLILLESGRVQLDAPMEQVDTAMLSDYLGIRR